MSKSKITKKDRKIIKELSEKEAKKISGGKFGGPIAAVSETVFGRIMDDPDRYMDSVQDIGTKSVEMAVSAPKRIFDAFKRGIGEW